MPIPTPPLDLSGGFFLLKYTNGTVTHRMRVHVKSFNDDATGSYIAPPPGGEASVNATFTALAGFLAPLVNNAFTMSLDAYFHVAAGVPTETFTPTAPATVAGTNATALPAVGFYEAYVMRTTGGKPFRLFNFARPSAAIGVPTTAVPNAAGNNNEKLCAYLQAATTAILGHDGNKPVNNIRVIDGVNRRVRRKAGEA